MKVVSRIKRVKLFITQHFQSISRLFNRSTNRVSNAEIQSWLDPFNFARQQFIDISNEIDRRFHEILEQRLLKRFLILHEVLETDWPAIEPIVVKTVPSLQFLAGEKVFKQHTHSCVELYYR